MGIRADTHLVGQQYALLGTILYIGILIGEVRVPLRPRLLQVLMHQSGSRQLVAPASPCGQIPGVLGDSLGMSVDFFLTKGPAARRILICL